MNHWDPYMNGPFSTSSGHDNEAGWMDNNVPPMAPLSATTPNEATPTQVMPMAYYPPAAPYGYWCPPVAPPAPLVSPVHLDSPDSPDGFDSPDSSDMMPPAPPLGLGAEPNMAHVSAWPMGGKENTPPMTPDDAAIPYGMTAPYAENIPPAGSTAPVAVPGTCATPGFVPGALPYAPLYYPPMAPQPYAPVMPYGYPAAPLPPYYGEGTPYAPGFPISYGPYR